MIRLERREIFYSLLIILLLIGTVELSLPSSAQAMPTGQIALPTVYGAAHCYDTSIGLTPLMDLGIGRYYDFEGGLYPNGSDVPPASYLAIGQEKAQKIKPLGSNGQPDPLKGRIVLLSIGMSNTNDEFGVFQAQAIGDKNKNPKVRIINGAQPGSTADEIINPRDPYWTFVQRQLAAGQASDAQVQAIWLKEAIDYSRNPPASFPADAQNLQSDAAAIVNILENTFPNLQIIYLSSRTYGGYASIPLNPETYAYDSGFAVKWLIEDRINGVTRGPSWLAWGPYLWADGNIPRSDGLQWFCSDFDSHDGTHPSASAEEKVAGMLTDFFKSDPTTVGWYLKP